ncbi:complement factor I [Spea bombifrons]|uniref:complement factor I n=1 Tax=Spea bombifrons TaxID=233779 RepID=UPI002349D560|nr:complement factor I [Spea bombifrons]
MKTLVCGCILFCLFLLPTAERDDATKACLEQKYNSNSCHKVFCAPWQRCVDGRCICKLPYQCPRNSTLRVCTEGKRTFQNYCQLKSAECSNPIYRFSSEPPCTETFEMSLVASKKDSAGILKVKVPTLQKSLFLCSKGWSLREANVACRQLAFTKGADASAEQTFSLPAAEQQSSDCLSVTCRGLETTLAECHLQESTESGDQRAGVVCYTASRQCNKDEFSCVNGKCIPSFRSCDGENDCGDLSDELCCTSCNNSFHCKSDTCIPLKYKCNKEVDCISVDDEANCNDTKTEIEPKTRSENENSEEQYNARSKDMDEERKLLRHLIPTLNCGIAPQKHARQKRIIGGEKAYKNQFPWQVAIKDGSSLNCGGIYIGGCWVLTAAHCVRPNKPERYRIIIELLDRLSYDNDIDSFPVKTVKVHELYNPNTYENDIALLEVINIYKKPECMQVDNNLVAACVPWSPFQFTTGDTCTVSGWGRQEGFAKVFHLKYGHVNLMNNCSEVYKDRFLDKMECAGTYDGSIDACKGDSGGPLVCVDVNNVAYAWGIVSWGENCGVAGFPGVYTKVAHYYEWISRQVGRTLIAKHNI